MHYPSLCFFYLKFQSINLNFIKTYRRYKPTFDTKSFQPFDSQTLLVKTLDFFKSLQPGGDWRPNHLNDSKLCTASHLEHIVFIVPFSRDRNENLKLFLLNIHSYLQTAEFKFRYTILVVEQGEPGLFNKGMWPSLSYLFLGRFGIILLVFVCNKVSY